MDLKTQLDNFATFVDAFKDLIEFFPKSVNNLAFSSEMLSSKK